MEKNKYLRPRTSKVNVKVDSFILTGSDLKYNSTGLGHGGISGKGNGGNASAAFSKRGYWEF